MMKLIDLLVQELPKRGGWPEGADYCVFDKPDGYRVGFTEGGEPVFRSDSVGWSVLGEACETSMWHIGSSFNVYGREIHDWKVSIITREQYEAALAGSAWNGEGLPPVGCECEYSLNAGATWYPCKIEYVVGTQGVVMSCDVGEGVQYVSFDTYGSDIFRTARTEAERKREERITTLNKFISGFMKSTDGDYTQLGEAIYEWQNVLDRVKK